jgi:uncharacterized protein YndB with AHSA1/START domain
MSNSPIIVEERFDSSPQVVWRAITDIDEMRQWYFDNLPAFIPEIGFEVSFEVKSERRIFTHRWKVTDVVPPKRISYNWKYDDYPGDSVVTFELFQQNKITRLKLTHRVVENFPQNIPEFQRESCISGWSYFIQDCLKTYLTSKDRNNRISLSN